MQNPGRETGVEFNSASVYRALKISSFSFPNSKPPLNFVLFCLLFSYHLTVVDSAIMDSDDDGDGVSFRMVLPSESHRKRSRDRLRSASESVSSLATSHGDLSGV